VVRSPELEVGVCLLAPDGSVLHRDAPAERLLGVPVPLGAGLAELVDWLAPLDPAVAGTLSGPAGLEATVTPTGLDEAAAVVRLTRPVPVDALARDLQTARQTLESILDAAPVTILALDLHKRVTLWNATGERMFGWTAEEIVGQPYPLVGAGHAASFNRLFAQVISGQGFTNVEAVRHRKNGEPIDLRIHTAPMRDADGVVTGAMAILEDLTETRRLEEQIRHAQKMEAVGRLAGGVAHDFNNLLTVILGMSEMLAREEELTPRMSKGLSQIADCGESARRLTQQLLAFSRRQVLRPQIADMTARVRATAEMLERLIGEQVALCLDLASEPLPVEVDTGQFDQVLVNLVVNACDAMKERGGRLWLRTSRVDVTRAGSVPPGAYARLDVRDDGPGIPAGTLPHVFDPFFTTKAPGQGTGLGLATVHGIVEQSGGAIEVESAEGEGTTFRVWLPLIELGARDAEAQEREADASGGESILLVEDDPEVRDVLARMIGALGYPVETASDGRDALERLATGLAPDLVVTDLAMPGMDGPSLAAALLRDHPALAVVFMSANLDDPAIREEVEAGRAAFVQKPVSMASLSRAIRARLESSERARGT